MDAWSLITVLVQFGIFVVLYVAIKKSRKKFEVTIQTITFVILGFFIGVLLPISFLWFGPPYSIWFEDFTGNIPPMLVSFGPAITGALLGYYLSLSKKKP